MRDDDPRKLVASFGVNGGPQSYMLEAFAVAYGTPNIFVGGAGNHCASGKHFIGGLTHASWVSQPDYNYCNYFLNFGVPVGTGAYYGVNTTVRKMAEARARGMKHVVLDPWMGMPAQSADEWVPIIPGTDAAVALAMVNLLLNEYGVYDAHYLAHETNGPYLVKEDGHYFRDADGKPQMWDAVEGRAKAYDASFQHVALEVDETIDGKQVRSAFTVIKEHVKKYTPEMAAEISDVPAGTIRRLAREFGEEARIGDTITVEGHELPYRPVALAYFKGPQAHRHSSLTSTALELLSAVVGVRSVPGSYIGINARSVGHPETGFPKWSPSDGPDGLLVTGRWVVPPSQPWPPVYPKKPLDLGLAQLIPPSHGNTPMLPLVAQEPEKYGIDYKPAIHIHGGHQLRHEPVRSREGRGFLQGRVHRQLQHLPGRVGGACRTSCYPIPAIWSGWTSTPTGWPTAAPPITGRTPCVSRSIGPIAERRSASRRHPGTGRAGGHHAGHQRGDERSRSRSASRICSSRTRSIRWRTW